MWVFPYGQGVNVQPQAPHVWEWAMNVLPTGVQVIPNLLTVVLQAWWKVISLYIKHFPPHKPRAVKGCRDVWKSSAHRAQVCSPAPGALLMDHQQKQGIRMGIWGRRESKILLIRAKDKRNKTKSSIVHGECPGIFLLYWCFSSPPNTAMPPSRSPPERSLLRPFNTKKVSITRSKSLGFGSQGENKSLKLS